MAVTAIWAVHTRFDHVVRYVADTEKTANLMFDDLKNMLEYIGDDYKTEMKYYSTGINCQPDTAYREMKSAYSMNDKPLKNLGYHGYQSFAKGEVTAQTAHEIGVKMAEELWGDKFQVVVATHLDKQHYHNHFAICSTSFIDGSRYHDCRATYMRLREVSDRLCSEHGLSVVETPQHTGKQYAEWDAERQQNPTWRGLIKNDINRIISESVTDKQFFYLLRQNGYAYKIGKDISVRPNGKERFVRLARNFGAEYTQESINRRILTNEPNRKSPAPERKTVKYLLRGRFLNTKRMRGLRGLYLHYCYKLGIFSQSKQSPPRLEFVLREDLLKLNTISEETKLLTRCHIDTQEQLFSYREGVQERIESLTSVRKKLRNKVRTVGTDENRKMILRTEISSISKTIADLRKEVKLCDGIAERSGVIRGKLSIRKENERDEHGWRRSRPDHESDARGH